MRNTIKLLLDSLEFSGKNDKKKTMTNIEANRKAIVFCSIINDKILRTAFPYPLILKLFNHIYLCSHPIRHWSDFG